MRDGGVGLSLVFKGDANSVKRKIIDLGANRDGSGGIGLRKTVDAQSNILDALNTVEDGISGGGVGQQRLCSADVAGGLSRLM